MLLEVPLLLNRPRAHTLCRRDPRYLCSIPFTVQRFLRYGPVVTCGMTLDVSRRGMSALVCGVPRVGETVIIELPSSERTLEILSTVRHSTNARSGFEFFPLSPMALRGIEDWIEELGGNEDSFPFLHAAPKFGNH